MATTTINGLTVNLTIEELAQLLNIANGATIEKLASKKPKATPKAAKPATKAETKQAERRAKHDAILDTKRVDRMVKTAQDKMAAQGFTTKASKQGFWVWIYPTDGKGRTPEFKAAKLAKGWKYSPKRGAWYRDFKAANC